MLAYAYCVRYNDWIRSQELTFLSTVALVSVHALSFLVTKWSVTARALIDGRPARSLRVAQRVRITPVAHKGDGDFVPVHRTRFPDGQVQVSFTYQGDKYIHTVPDPDASPTSISRSSSIDQPLFRRLPYPADGQPEIGHIQAHTGLADEEALREAYTTYGRNVFDIPVPTFASLFAQHAVAPFFVFQVFCVCLWMLDEYWYYSLFSLGMLILFESTVVWQRLRTLNEFRTMTIQPFVLWVYRAHKWIQVLSTDLFPGDMVSVQRSKEDSGLPCDLLLCTGTAIVNEAMLSGESTPLLKESIALRSPTERLNVHGAERNSVLFGGTKVLQTTSGGPTSTASPSQQTQIETPDGGALAIVLRTGFGTTQGGLVRLMVYTNEGRVGAGNRESFYFIVFLLVFAMAAS